MRVNKILLVPAVTALTLSAGLAAAPATAQARAPIPKPTPNPWQMRHWPQTQPWQQSQQMRTFAAPGAPKPIDPQNYELPDTMTWDDYKPIPGTAWADPTKKGSIKNFKGAVVLVDYPNQPFVVTQPKNSTIYGNPSLVGDVPKDKVAQFYQDFLNKPQALNRGHTLHEYWMEDSGGRYGVDLKAFGAYTMKAKDHEYGIGQFQQAGDCPSGDTCGRDIRADARAAWVADVGEEVANQYEFVFFLTAGQDESATWQEFGMMKFPTKEDVPDEWGPPDPSMPNWANTRYVPWTSWQAASNHWPNAVIGAPPRSSTQAESSGMGVFAHEFSHILGILDNYNNPYGNPPRRAYTGPWEMLSRGSFNGPGGPHSRWMIPATGGASMGAQHTLRNKLKLGIVDTKKVLQLDRATLPKDGTAVAKVTARAVQPGKDSLAGINVRLGAGDKADLSPPCDTSKDPLCDGGKYNNYTVEVVDRMGFDSFTPDSGVLLSKTKDADDAPFIWVKDSNPEDIDKVDYVLPNGQQVKMTIGDYRQLSDALMHAGTNSGSEYEHVDAANRLHFYVLDLKRDRKGVLSYTVAVRSLDGAGTQRRGVKVDNGFVRPAGSGWVKCTLPLRNSGKGGTGYHGSDVYRLSASATGKGWTTVLPNALATAKAGRATTVQVWAKAAPGADRKAKLVLKATSESDPTKVDTGNCRVR
ncbi:M6 family metalloprotease domain-containing protein [Actinomadura rudentiformis]|uniref:M6 family metalloprotease domain-containing protein n=1 Tax=Actinomadura rudentiformis TaxID=359158 RepID=A0A6H9YBE2_9ACTN|nr:M6 family metalloprotease domain-containing protein [Actinomadura rudentiformis]KAB2341273.1 M6 family metalloprotease domain-containing protein [Actinomadura rudentiformis]